MPRTPARLAGRAIVAGIALSALTLLAASPASAHTNNLYTYAGYSDPAGFATMSRTNADVTILPSSAQNYDEMIGAEVFDEVGTAIGVNYGEPYEYFVLGWNHTTGAEDAGVAAFITGAEEGSLYVSGLDTLADGTTITYVEYFAFGSGEFPEFFSAIATVNKVTGELTPVINLTQFADDDFYVDSLATDPISGVTYAFLFSDTDQSSYYSALDFADSSASDPAAFTGSGFDGLGGELLGADFDHDGTLYFTYANNAEEQYELSTVTGPSTWPTAARQFIGEVGTNYPGGVSLLALTLEYTALAATGTIFPVVWLVAATVAVLGGAVTVVSVTSRRKRQGA